MLEGGLRLHDAAISPIPRASRVPQPAKKTCSGAAALPYCVNNIEALPSSY
jgi:hypothetical protein